MNRSAPALEAALLRVDWDRVDHAYGPASSVPEILRAARDARDAVTCAARLLDLQQLFAHQGTVETSFPLLVEPLLALGEERREPGAWAEVARIVRTGLVAARGSSALGQGMPWVPGARLWPTGIATGAAIREHGASLRDLVASPAAPLRTSAIALWGSLGLDADLADRLAEQLAAESDRYAAATTLVALASSPAERAERSLAAARSAAASGDPLVRVSALACRRVLGDVLTEPEGDELLAAASSVSPPSDAFPPCGGSLARLALEAYLMRGFDAGTWPQLLERIDAGGDPEEALARSKELTRRAVDLASRAPEQAAALSREAETAALLGDELDARRTLVASKVVDCDPVDRIPPDPEDLSKAARELLAYLADRHGGVLRRLGLVGLVERYRATTARPIDSRIRVGERSTPVWRAVVRAANPADADAAACRAAVIAWGEALPATDRLAAACDLVVFAAREVSPPHRMGCRLALDMADAALAEEPAASETRPVDPIEQALLGAATSFDKRAAFLRRYAKDRGPASLATTVVAAILARARRPPAWVWPAKPSTTEPGDGTVPDDLAPRALAELLLRMRALAAKADRDLEPARSTRARQARQTLRVASDSLAVAADRLDRAESAWGPDPEPVLEIVAEIAGIRAALDELRRRGAFVELEAVTGAASSIRLADEYIAAGLERLRECERGLAAPTMEMPGRVARWCEVLVWERDARLVRPRLVDRLLASIERFLAAFARGGASPLDPGPSTLLRERRRLLALAPVFGRPGVLQAAIAELARIEDGAVALPPDVLQEAASELAASASCLMQPELASREGTEREWAEIVARARRLLLVSPTRDGVSGA